MAPSRAIRANRNPGNLLFWRVLQNSSKETVAKNNPVVWFEIHVQNIERAKKFYEAVLGVKLEHMKPPGPASEEMVTFPMEMNASGAAGALVKMHGVPSGRNSIIVYFQCDDCAAECKRVPVNGGKITKEEFAIGEHGFISLLNDTEGNVIGLHSMK